jgi:undecaprenyl-diphosphatase
LSILEAIILAIIEGITEFLPVSSTGHMIIGSSVMGIAHLPFTKAFTVAIQLGAILSVFVLYWRRFFQTINFYFKLLVAFIPSAIAGLLLKKHIDALLENVLVVAVSLLAGGIVLLFVDRWFRETERYGKSDVTYPKAFKIGMFQLISMIPGVSRSAATIIGGLTQKLNRKAAAEFSFFLAMPTMLGATVKSLYDYYKDYGMFSSEEIKILAIGNVVAFIIALLAIKTFITFLARNGFKAFGWYRIIVGLAIIILYFAGVNLSII